MSGYRSVEDNDPLNEPYKAAVLVLFSLDVFREAISSQIPRCPCNTQCTINAFSEVFRKLSTSGQYSITQLRKPIEEYLRYTENYPEDPSQLDPIDVISALLSNYHSLAATKRCYESPDSLLADCQGSCVLHKYFHLGVTEIYRCKCGRTLNNNWDINNICQFYNISGIFEEFNEGISRILAKIPSLMLEKSGQGNSRNFKGIISQKLRMRLENATSDMCEDEDCPVKDSSIAFEIYSAPKVYIIDLIWDENEVSSLYCFLAAIGAKNNINLIDIYKKGKNITYLLHGILFSKEAKLRFAHLKNGFWKFEGLNEEATWYELITECAFLNYKPVALIYVDSNKPGQMFDPSLKKLLKIEQMVMQCSLYKEEYGEYLVKDNTTGLFSQVKKREANNFKENFRADQAGMADLRPREIERVEKYEAKKYEKKGKAEELEGYYQINGADPRKNAGNYVTPGGDSPVYNYTPEKNARNNIENFENKKPGSNFEAVPVVQNERKIEEKKREEKKYQTVENKDVDEQAQPVWICNCGKNNVTNYCTRCYEVRPSEKGWKCSLCSSLNNETSVRCSNCHAFKQEIKQEPNQIIAPKRNFADAGIKPAEKNPFKKEEVKVEIWDCKCGTSNMPDYDVCPKCSNIKPGLTGWVCKSCKVLNGEERYRCGTCGSSKLSDHAPMQDYWICENCNSAIVNAVDFCDNCMIKKKRDKEIKIDKKPRDNYVACKYCNKETTVELKYCMWCKSNLEDKKEIEYPGVNPNAGRITENEWECKKCSTSNELRRTYCKICYTDKPIEKEPATRAGGNRPLEDKKEIEYPGVNPNAGRIAENEWECKKCNTSNELRRVYCKICGNDKPTEKELATRAGGNRPINKQNYPGEEKKKEEKWTCLKCKRPNDDDTIKCYFCKTLKDSAGAANKFGIDSYYWKCIHCDSQNLNSDSTCKRCKKNKNQEKVSDILVEDRKDIWICSKCKIKNKNYENYCQGCFYEKNKPYPEERNYESNKCSECKKELKLVYCTCKKPAQKSLGRCRFCGKDISKISICTTCADKPQNQYVPTAYRKYN